MPSALREHQYELAPVDGEGLVFGTEDTGYLTLSRPIHSGGDGGQTGDLGRPYEDGIQFGRDYQGGKSIAFEMGVLTDVNNAALRPGSVRAAHRMNLDYLDVLEGWWRDPVWRNGPRALAMMRACEGGVVSRAYGRPRRYDEVVGAATRQGYSNVACDFQLVDNRWYADVEKTVDVGLISPPDGGLVAPLVAPLTTTVESESEVLAYVGGTKPTWLMVEFVGPALNPSVTVGDLTVGIEGSLAYDERVVIDPRPWVRTALRNTDGASFAGVLSKQTPAMTAMAVRPGTHMVQFRGRDATGSARCRLRWRDARSRP